MATLDIFNNDAFQLAPLTTLINDIPRVPTVLGDMGIFREYGITSTTMMIERTGTSLSLVPTAPRGGVGQPLKSNSRKLLPVAAVHLPQRDEILADVVQGVREVGSETAVKTLTGVIQARQTLMRANLDLTLEYHRIGAVKGQILDTDGSVLLDLYALMGKTRQTHFFDIATATTSADLKDVSVQLKRKVRNALGGKPFTKVLALVSEGFFDALIRHKSMKAAWDRWQDGAFLRTDQSKGDFEAFDVIYRIYSGGVDGQDFVESGLGYAIPLGVPGMFETAYAPADYMETVNTLGLPFYSKQERLKFDKGVEVESQSNPINLCTLPEAVIQLDVDAS